MLTSLEVSASTSARRITQDDADGAGPLFVNLQHRGGIQLQIDVAQDRWLVGRQVEKYLLGSAMRSLCTDDVDFHDRTAQVSAGVVDGDVVDDRDPTVRHRIAEVARQRGSGCAVHLPCAVLGGGGVVRVGPAAQPT